MHVGNIMYSTMITLPLNIFLQVILFCSDTVNVNITYILWGTVFTLEDANRTLKKGLLELFNLIIYPVSTRLNYVFEHNFSCKVIKNLS